MEGISITDILPNEVLSHIIEFLSEETILPFSLCCKKIHALVSSNKNLLKALAFPLVQLSSDIATPLRALTSETVPISDLKEGYVESKRRLSFAAEQMRHGGRNAVTFSKCMRKYGVIKLIATNTSEDKVLIYCKSGGVHVFSIDFFSNDTHSDPLFSFWAPCKIRKITFLSHTIALGPSNTNDGTSSYLYNAFNGNFYGHFDYNADFNFCGISINEYYAVITCKIPHCPDDRPFILSFYAAIPKEYSHVDSQGAPGPFFEEMPFHMRLSHFTDVCLDRKFDLFVYDQPLLSVFHLGFPVNHVDMESFVRYDIPTPHPSTTCSTSSTSTNIYSDWTSVSTNSSDHYVPSPASSSSSRAEMEVEEEEEEEERGAWWQFPTHDCPSRQGPTVEGMIQRALDACNEACPVARARVEEAEMESGSGINAEAETFKSANVEAETTESVNMEAEVEKIPLLEGEEEEEEKRGRISARVETEAEMEIRVRA